jgi:hypothetical protein
MVCLSRDGNLFDPIAGRRAPDAQAVAGSAVSEATDCATPKSGWKCGVHRLQAILNKQNRMAFIASFLLLTEPKGGAKLKFRACTLGLVL